MNKYLSKITSYFLPSIIGIVLSLCLLFAYSAVNLRFFQTPQLSLEEFLDNEGNLLLSVHTPFENAAKLDPFLHAPYYALLHQYEKRFELLQQEYRSLLLALIEEGQKEYLSFEGPMTWSEKFNLANRLLYQANILEKQCDTEMEHLLSQFATSLEQGGYDPAIVKEIKDYYNQYKKYLRAYFFKKYGDYIR